MRVLQAGLLGWLFTAALAAQTVTGPLVRIQTNLGNVDITLLPDSAPNTVANFLNYVNKGAYNNSFVHRLVKSFVWQGGGYQLVNHQRVEIPQDAPVANEYKLSNIRGTVAMAKLDGQPDSATNQWFFNLVDNSSNLNNTNGGFTVFARVANANSLAVMDRIAAQTIYNLGSPYDTIPLTGYTGTLQDSNYILISSITDLQPVTATAVVSAASFGGFNAAAPGSYLEIYGTNLATAARGWAETDFTASGGAPKSVDDVSVTVGGFAAFVNYVSPGQVNVQVPAGIANGAAVPVVVTNLGVSSAPITILIRTLEPGLLAPLSFLVNGKQYVAAVHSSTGSFVSGGNIAGVPAAPAVGGETLTFYGTGFGPVTPAGNALAGQIASGQTALTANVKFTIGGVDAPLSYAGFAPGLVGVDQFNVAVPAGLATGDQPVQVTVNGAAVPQTLFLASK